MLYSSILPLFFFVLPHACTTETFLSISPENLDCLERQKGTSLWYKHRVKQRKIEAK